QTEGNGSYDQASVQVSNNGGTSYTTIASSTNSAQLPLVSSWTTASFDLSAYAGQTILVRFAFDTIDSVLNTYEGWYVDDVQLSTPGAWNDYYSFTVPSASAATVGMKNLTGSGNSLTLLNSGGGTVATGATGATNLDQVISNVSLAAGTYFLKLSN